jgi:nucleoside-diphosphate-sugar epimerase
VILALTGGTGFVGGQVMTQALAAGHAVRALTRRPQPARDGVTWVPGDLAAPGDLARAADAVVHVAGVVNAPDRAGFVAGNVEGTRAILTAAREAGVSRFVHVSSLAAREPQLSAYGWSKAQAEREVQESALDWTIVRPPAVYGPGDLEQLDLWRLAARGIALLPPAGRMSAILVDDLAALLLRLAESEGPRTIYEADDGAALTHREYAEAIGRALDRRGFALPLPAFLLRLGGRLDRLARGSRAKLTPDRAAYLAHPDWSVDPARRPPPDLWTPRTSLAAGMARTAAWYREQGLL